MPDPRFFITNSSLSVGEAARIVGGSEGSSEVPDVITSVASINDKDLEGRAVFCADKEALASLVGRTFGLCLTTSDLARAGQLSGPVIEVASPKLAFAALANHLHASRDDLGVPADGPPQIDPHADIHDTVVVSAGAKIAAGVRIGPFCHIGCGVVIGEGAQIGSHVSISHTLLGRGAVILSGAKIGQSGFGFAESPEGLVRIPQLGRVVIGDDVEIGANTTIDRGALSDTVIGDGAKIDNLIQIGHNVKIGKNCVIASQTGISGSCVIGDNVMVGGQVGVADHITIGDGAQLTAGSGVIRDVEPGVRVGGYPAQPIKKWLRETATLARIAKKRIK